MFGTRSNSIKKGTAVIDKVYFFSELPMLDCNQIVIESPDKENLILFDAGNGLSLNAFIKGMKKKGLDPEKISRVYLTHEHLDHVIGLYPLLDMLKENPPELFAYGVTAKILREGDQSKIIPANLGVSPDRFGITIRSLEVNDISKKNEVILDNSFKFNIYHTPGHSEGSVTYYNPNKRILIPGDLVFTGGSFGRYDFPGGSLKKLKKSIEFVNELDVKYILPGHMNYSSNGNQEISRSNKVVHSLGGFF
ncbi:MAG: MBL fold metallo-hydrolase [Promethearchaeia archaeon]